MVGINGKRRPWYGTRQFAITPPGWKRLLASLEDWRVATTIAAGADKFSGEYYATHETLAADALIHVRNLKQTIKRLVAKGIVCVSKRGQRGYIYTVHECPSDSAQGTLSDPNPDSVHETLSKDGPDSVHGPLSKPNPDSVQPGILIAFKKTPDSVDPPRKNITIRVSDISDDVDARARVIESMVAAGLTRTQATECADKRTPEEITRQLAWATQRQFRSAAGLYTAIRDSWDPPKAPTNGKTGEFVPASHRTTMIDGEATTFATREEMVAHLQRRGAG